MKKRILGILTVALALGMVFAMVSCDTGGSSTASVTVTYNANGWTNGSALPSGGKVTVGKVIALPTLTDTATQTFVGWSLTGSSTNNGTGGAPITDYVTVKGTDPTFYVLWTSKSAQTPYNISFDADGWVAGTVALPTNITGATGSRTVSLPDLAADDTATMKFLGWATSAKGNPIAGTYPISQTVTSATTFYVVWTNPSITYAITINANGWTVGTVALPVVSAPLSGGSKITLPDLATDDTATQVFDGWSTSTTGPVFTGTYPIEYTVSAVATLYVIWHDPTSAPTGLTIRFEPYTGYTGTPITIVIGEDVPIGDWDGTLPDGPARPGYQFAYWTYNDVRVDGTTSFSTDVDPVVGYYWSTQYSDTTGAEKVRLNNGGMVIYEFDISALASDSTVGVTIDDLAKINGLKVKQQMDEATLATKSVRAFRVLGPYAYNGDDFVVNQGTWSNGDILWGDFKETSENMVIAKMDGTGAYTVASMQTFNKFHSYMIVNGTGNTQGAAQWGAAPEVVQTTVTGGEWFDVQYAFSNTIPDTDTNGQKYGETLLRLKNSGAIGNLLPFGTNYNKVYFAFGPSTADATSSVTYLIKDVKLSTVSDGDIDGAIPDWDQNPLTREQTFACYEDASRLINWRGDPGDTIVDRVAGTGEAPLWEGEQDEAPSDANSFTGSFYLRLGSWNAAAYHSSADHPKPAGSWTGNFTEGPLSLTYSAQNMRTSIALTPAQTAILNEADRVVRVTIAGTMGGESNNNWRYFLGDAGASTWNLSSGSGRVAAPGLVDDGSGGQKVFTDTLNNDVVITHFILQMGDANGGGYNGTPETITIDSIKIEYTVTPPEPCNCETSGIPCDGTFMLGCDGMDAGKVCNCVKGTVLNNNSLGIAGLVAAGGPQIRQLAAGDGGGLFITNRTGNYFAVDIDIKNITGFDDASTYVITVEGKVVADSTITELEAQIAQAERPWAGLGTTTIVDAQGDLGDTDVVGVIDDVVEFTVTTTKTGAELINRTVEGGGASPDPNKIRVRVNQVGDAKYPSYLIDSITITKDGSAFFSFPNP